MEGMCEMWNHVTAISRLGCKGSSVVETSGNPRPQDFGGHQLGSGFKVDMAGLPLVNDCERRGLHGPEGPFGLMFFFS